MTDKKKFFAATVWQHYRQQGRHDLPWRKTKNPYQIFVSELMLQQTQVERVLPKYSEFLKRFPTARRLAAAPLGDVLRAWQGLGYNRRAKFLHQAAKKVVREMKGKWPLDEPGWRSLPGVGPYTAGAVMVFAYNEPVVLIETNVRQVFLHYFFKNKEAVTDAAILKLVAKTLPQENPREWYWALMDYGAHLKKLHGNANHQSKHYSKQSNFQDSDRQIRGAILKRLSTYRNGLTVQRLQNDLSEFNSGRVTQQLACLVSEGLVIMTGQKYGLH